MKYLLAILATIALLLFTGASDGLTTQVLDLTKRVEVLESYLPQQLVVSGKFTGQGNSQTSTFTVSHTPWLIKWSTHIPIKARTTFTVYIHDPESRKEVGGYGFQIGEDTTTGQTYSYLPAGTYYLKIDTGGYVQWGIDIK
ncbi:hypothetical protein LCGC14_0392990 [marine sediment metagenome]|uniref:FlgD Ig-like domain-containing protein n=1 Tax=marine sediment metagenome TaxID=412755 RepID=A0A0F9W813_9ZZZZ